MIGNGPFNWEYIPDDEKPEPDHGGFYFCQCRLIQGVANCPEHGDPVERFPAHND